MRIGIDFGTSYSAAAAMIDGALVPIRFGDALQFRTAVFFPEELPNADDFELTPERQAQVDAIVRSLRTQQAGGSDAQRQRDAIRVVRRQWMEEQTRSSAVSGASFQHAEFGEAAVEAYLEEGSGHLIESPKSMFGFRFDPRVRQIIVNIAAHILEHIRLTASRQLGVPVRAAVIGRPVEFRSSMGAAGGDQALGILRAAAASAGFDEVSFLEEPVAAAMLYHRSLTERQQALVVDIGGGTTDVAWAELGGAAKPLVRGSWGLPRGGTDLDVGISLHSLMPLFGKDVTKVPVHHFVEAASVHLLYKQREFRQQRYALVDAPYRARLQALQQPGATTRLNQLAERIKVELGEVAQARVVLDFIEADLRLAANQDDFNEAAGDFLGRVQTLLLQAREEMDTTPHSIFLTGGTSRSPQVRERVRACFPGVALVHGDPSLGVVSGLTVAAQD